MTCPNCNIDYADFRTGLSYSDVRATFWRVEPPWHSARRHSVLGRWHEIKQEMWAEHLANCERLQQQVDYEIDEY